MKGRNPSGDDLVGIKGIYALIADGPKTEPAKGPSRPFAWEC